MKIEIRLRIDVGDDGPGDEEILELDKPHDQLEKVGLSLAEAKELLGRVQDRVVGAQAAAFVADHRHCEAQTARTCIYGHLEERNANDPAVSQLAMGGNVPGRGHEPRDLVTRCPSYPPHPHSTVFRAGHHPRD